MWVCLSSFTCQQAPNSTMIVLSTNLSPVHQPVVVTSDLITKYFMTRPCWRTSGTIPSQLICLAPRIMPVDYRIAFPCLLTTCSSNTLFTTLLPMTKCVLFYFLTHVSHLDSRFVWSNVQNSVTCAYSSAEAYKTAISPIETNSGRPL